MRRRLKLGFDNYSLRSLGWKAPQLLDYAASLRLDSVLFSDLDVFENHSSEYLAEIRAHANSLGLDIQVGTLSICPTSVLWSNRFGSPKELLELTLRIAKALGSPVARCVLGNIKDRSSTGGIEARITETVHLLQSVRGAALDAGVKIAVENHAGDMQARELVTLIERAGTDFVGATMDCGNATWALEHPLRNLELLGPYALCSGIRDSALWETEAGAVLQWAAMGDGQIDFKAYFDRFAQLCPDSSVQIETITGRPNPIPYKTEGFWDAYPNARTRDSVEFFSLVANGRARASVLFSEDPNEIEKERRFQKSELERSIRYCHETLGLGNHAHPAMNQISGCDADSGK